MGVTGLHKHGRRGMHPGSPEERGRHTGGLHFTGEAQHAVTVLKLQVIGTGNITISDNRTQDHGGVEGS